MADSHKVSYELSRDLTLFQLTMMGMGMMIGAGVFLGIGNAIFVAGPGGVVLTFTLNTLIAMFTAMSYAELSSAIPKAGGAYNFARIGFGRGTSFIAGWMEWFASSIAGSMYAITFAIYTVRFLEQIDMLTWLPESYHTFLIKMVAVIIALFFILINYRGASETGMIGAIMTLGQMLFLVFIGGAGIYVAIKDPSRLLNFKPFLPHGWIKLLITMGFTYVAFEGFEVISQAGDEAIKPRKNLPKAMIYSVFAVGVVYVLVSIAAIVAVKAGSPGIDRAPWEWIAQFREKGFGEAIARLIPGLGNFLLTLAVIFASTSALNATIFSATRASYALGRDRMLPGFFSNISKKRKTPYMALIFTAIIILVNAVFLPTMDVASSASIMFLFLFFLVNICVIKIRLNMGNELSYGFIMPFFPAPPIIAICIQILLAIFLIHMSLIAWIIAPVWIIAGIIIYATYSKQRVLPSEDEITIIEEKADENIEGNAAPCKVMIPIANPHNAISMVGTTIKLCKEAGSTIQLLHMVEVPDLLALRDAEKYIMEGKEGIVEAMLYLMPRFPITTTIRHCRNIARGIVSAVREKKINLLIMGLHGHKADRSLFIGTTLDYVISRSPCNIVILKDCGNKKFNSVLVPVFDSGNDDYALEIADTLASAKGIITLLDTRKDKKPLSSEKYVMDFMNNSPQRRIEIIKAMNTDPLSAVAERVYDVDLLVMGIREKKHFYNTKIITIQEKIAHLSNTPLVLVKKPRGISSFTKRWF